MSDTVGHTVLGRPEDAELWLAEHPDMDSIDGRTAHRLFLALCQFPAMRASWLREIVKGSPAEIARSLGRFVDTGLVAVFDGRHYLSELGMRRAANMSRVRPDLLVQVSGGALGAGTHYIEFERTAVRPERVAEKLGPYRRMAAAGRALPLLMVCETARGRRNFRAAAGTLPMLTTTLERALAGPVTGAVTAWSRDGVPAALHCR